MRLYSLHYSSNLIASLLQNFSEPLHRIRNQSGFRYLEMKCEVPIISCKEITNGLKLYEKEQERQSKAIWLSKFQISLPGAKNSFFREDYLKNFEMLFNFKVFGVLLCQNIHLLNSGWIDRCLSGEVFVLVILYQRCIFLLKLDQWAQDP